MTSRWFAAMAVSVFLAAPAVAQVPDHLKCYKIKDPQAKATYTADLGGLVPEPGCTVKVPAKLLCVQVTTTNVNPPPINAPPANPPGDFLCYEVKCPRSGRFPVPFTDQFGARTVEANAAKMLCAPRIVGFPTSTVTTTSSTTTTTRCHFDAAMNGCQGDCPLAGQQCTLTTPDRCDCLPPSCHTCYVTVSNSCTAKLCASHADCIDQPNELCLLDQCDVACP
jgi:hypothetical protein